MTNVCTMEGRHKRIGKGRRKEGRELKRMGFSHVVLYPPHLVFLFFLFSYVRR